MPRKKSEWDFFRIFFSEEIVKLVTVVQTEGQKEFYTLLGSFMYYTHCVSARKKNRIWRKYSLDGMRL